MKEAASSFLHTRNMLSWSWRSINCYCCISLVFYIILPTLMMHGQTRIKFDVYMLSFQRMISKTQKAYVRFLPHNAWLPKQHFVPGRSQYFGPFVLMSRFLVNDQRDAQIPVYIFIYNYMFRAHSPHHQERHIVSIQPLVTIILCWWPSCVQVGSRIDTICLSW
jgi:hypothetical protein